ncbi:hypothetical protein [Thiohalophilus sp.]|uniref:hypothetical protein n=1 Tax=Thiohalophilus sp. TaxID=3028392 RepID=UPI002ACE5F5C|nr:hypothetical protein [Thiohalophilus sp.]MDZ7804298.1 hypothetical protein [Thiohalophilus sp.]
MLLEADKFLGFFSGGYGSNLQSPTKKLSRFDVFGAVPMGVDHNQITKESLYYLFQEQIEQRVCDAIDAMPWPDMDGLPPLSERPALIEKTIQELDKLHEEHAELVEQAEAAGIHVDRVFSDDKARKKWQMKQVEKAARDLEESGAYVGGKPLTSDDRR